MTLPLTLALLVSTATAGRCDCAEVRELQAQVAALEARLAVLEAGGPAS